MGPNILMNTFWEGFILLCLGKKGPKKTKIVQLYMLHLPGTAAVAGAETEGTGREAGAAAEG